MAITERIITIKIMLIINIAIPLHAETTLLSP
jgi:hypothetical protein